MTRRERLERKAARRREWAEKAHERSGAALNRADQISQRFEGGQPILCGHHSEARARKDQKRMHGSMAKGYEEHRKAEHHEQRADGLERQLDRSIFDDDGDAIGQLEARIAEREQEAARYTAINKAWRKGGIEAVKAIVSEKLAATIERTMQLAPWLKSPLDTTNIRASIRRDQKRLAELKARAR